MLMQIAVFARLTCRSTKAKFGEMLGLNGIFVDRPDRPSSAWQEALASDRPVVIEVRLILKSCRCLRI
jgi:thiamine pyrophosphate-dependent acetolactate synthase large subunit-like protein